MHFGTLRAEIEKTPFTPLRLHLTSGRTVDIRHESRAWMLEFALLVLQDSRDRSRTGNYDVIAPECVEKIEQLPL